MGIDGWVPGNSSHHRSSITFPKNKLADSGPRRSNLSIGKTGMFGDFILKHKEEEAI